MNNKMNPDNKKQTLMTDYITLQPRITTNITSQKQIVIKGYNPNTGHNHCLECGIDMGFSNGQLCRKSFCDGVIITEDSSQ